MIQIVTSDPLPLATASPGLTVVTYREVRPMAGPHRTTSDISSRQFINCTITNCILFRSTMSSININRRDRHLLVISNNAVVNLLQPVTSSYPSGLHSSPPPFNDPSLLMFLLFVVFNLSFLFQLLPFLLWAQVRPFI